MKLSVTQKETLNRICENESIHEDDSQAHGNTINSLYNKKLIQYWTYANGLFWEPTDLGIEINEKLNRK